MSFKSTNFLFSATDTCKNYFMFAMYEVKYFSVVANVTKILYEN